MIVVIGGGPAGFFAAITARQENSDQPVVLLEKHKDVLRKVAVSGGGRCNVTNERHDPRELAKFYPRGGRELRGPFHRFGPREIAQWFADQGTPLKQEPDGRIFPESDSSASIVNALFHAAEQSGVQIRTRQAVTNIKSDDSGSGFVIELADNSTLSCEKVLIATGGQTSGDGQGGLGLAEKLGHTIIPPVPSLFTFKIDDSLLYDLSGVAVPEVALKAVGPEFPNKGLTENGPVLFTHWGLSGPAVLRLSAWGARVMAEADYSFILRVDWCPGFDRNELEQTLINWAEENNRRQVAQNPELGMPRRLWLALLEKCKIDREIKWAELGKKNRNRLLEALKSTELEVDGKATNKEEFVTCGGVKLSEVAFKTTQSKRIPGLFFAGEVLDIDGITGGFNFQACWTAGYLAGMGVAE